MRNTLEHFTDVKIIECSDFLTVLPSLVPSGNILLVTSKGFSNRGVVARVVDKCGPAKVTVFDDVTPNPEKSHLQTSMTRFAQSDIEHVIALGGGSVIDAAKVFCALLSHQDLSLDDLLLAENVANKVNLIAIPTTSGTGAEVTPFATVWQSDIAKKYSLYGIRANVTLLDPSLTLSLATNETLYPALDALSHALESLWNRNRTKTSQEYALCSITLICANLRLVLDSPCSLEARKNLQKAATLSGLAISITKTAIAHAISYPLTLQYGMPHGLACSFTLQAILTGQKAGVLGITEQLKQDIIELMRSLHLERSLKHYLSFSELMALFDKKLDAARAANFIDVVDKDWLLNILHNSWSQNVESGIET